jgi:carboxylesterase type B
VQSYISLVGGDPTKVTAMGESAGAGSILHHLVGEGGTLDPLFKKAILQSPAYEFMWDRKGTSEEIFQEFAGFAGCPGGSMTCLRSASASALVNAATQLNAAVPDGSFAVGMSKQIPLKFKYHMLKMHKRPCG